MDTMLPHLNLDRCPWCNTAKPTMEAIYESARGTAEWKWMNYQCTRCDNIVLARQHRLNTYIVLHYPKGRFNINKSIPENARMFLKEALAGVKDAPNSSVMACASALDIMLYHIGYPSSKGREGAIFARINLAFNDNKITAGMAKWAHYIRDSGNLSRHPGAEANSDEAKEITSKDAEQCLEFALALADLLFVLPARFEESTKETEPKNG